MGGGQANHSGGDEEMTDADADAPASRTEAQAEAELQGAEAQVRQLQSRDSLSPPSAGSVSVRPARGRPPSESESDDVLRQMRRYKRKVGQLEEQRGKRDDERRYDRALATELREGANCKRAPHAPAVAAAAPVSANEKETLEGEEMAAALMAEDW